MSPTVLLIGTLDTKGDEYGFLRDRLRAAGVDVLLADVGTLEPPGTTADISREEVAAGTGADLSALAEAREAKIPVERCDLDPVDCIRVSFIRAEPIARV